MAYSTMLMQLVAGTVDMALIQCDCCFVIPTLGFTLWLASQTATKLVARLVVECEVNFTRGHLLAHIFGATDLNYPVINEH